MKIGTKLCVHCGCIVAMKVGEKWICQKCELETTPQQESEYRQRAIATERKKPIDPSMN
jgi:hypothetical protein